MDKKCTAVGCKDGKVALLIGFADCKECNGFGCKYHRLHDNKNRNRPHYLSVQSFFLLRLHSIIGNIKWKIMKQKRRNY
jgi:hypothetical protein